MSTKQQQISTSCSKYEVPTLTPVEYLKRGNQTLLDLFDIKEEQIQKMADDLFGNSIELQKPVLKRGVHINEDFGLADPIEQEEDSDSNRNWEEEDSDSKRNWEEKDPDAKVQLQEHLLEQQQYDLIWSPFGQRMVTPKDFKTFEEPVELIIKPVKQEPVKQEPVKIKQNLFEKLLQKYKKKADNINAIIERQEAERQEEAARQQQEAQNTFYDFAELADCFEANDEEEEEEEKQQKQQNPEQCNCLQEDQEEEKCEECQKKPPKKLKKFEKCYTLPLINVFL
jgi:hypothetical protein